MIIALGVLVAGVALLVIGTRFRSSMAGSVLVILGSAVVAVGVILLSIEGMQMTAEQAE